MTRKFSSCSTIFIDDSTVSQPNLKNTIRAVALAVYFHIKNRNRGINGSVYPPDEQDDRLVEIFDEKLHPLSVSELLPTYLLSWCFHYMLCRCGFTECVSVIDARLISNTLSEYIGLLYGSSLTQLFLSLVLAYCVIVIVSNNDDDDDDEDSDGDDDDGDDKVVNITANLLTTGFGLCGVLPNRKTRCQRITSVVILTTAVSIGSSGTCSIPLSSLPSVLLLHWSVSQSAPCSVYIEY